MMKQVIFILSLLLLIIISCYFGLYNTPIMELVSIGSLSGEQLSFREQEFRRMKEHTILKEGIDISNNSLTTDAKEEAKHKYNKDNVDVEYHDDLQKIGVNSIYNTQMGTQKVYDVNGNLIDIISNAVQGNIVYYKPGSYKYGATSYVPYYEDSVFLSRSINAVVNTPTYVSTNKGGGFCNKYKTDPLKLEEQCNKINDETCAATTCCVLLGDQKCVSGNESGPTMKDNYSDSMIINKDFYYYQGKCYGNCPNTAQIATPSLPEKTPYMNM
jgi:hypothetical protein